MDSKMLESAVIKLQKYIESENYKGYDPYDLLLSPLFKLPLLKSNKWLRFAAQQFGKRFPINVRPLLAVPKGYNPVTLGLCIQAYSNLMQVNDDKKDLYQDKINFLIDELVKMIPAGFHGACWGYDFDWEARYAKISAYQPTVVATGIITNALFKHYQLTGNITCLELCKSATQFVLLDLNKGNDAEGDYCFSYSPFDNQIVFNASMKAVRILAQVYSISKNEELMTAAKSAVSYVVKHQRHNGAWFYSTASKGHWIDNYHTGYILDCLDEYCNNTNDNAFDNNIKKGYEYYRQNFFTVDFIPKFYDNSIYPVDCTAAAQSIITLLRFNDLLTAKNVGEWMINNMQKDDGSFYFRKFKHYRLNTSFMRWSNAWMLAALSTLRNEMKKANL